MVALDIWMNGEAVGVWSPSRAGTPVFQYQSEWIASERGRPISISLPFLPGNQPHRGAAVSAWFDNLLPDSEPIRERLRRRFGARSAGSADLLAAIGRDCVGATQIVPSGADPGNVRVIESDAITDAEVAGVLRGVTQARSFGSTAAADDLRISIAGAQEKTALLRLDGRWHRPRGATPTTHILKLPLGLVGNMRANMRNSVENEWLCMEFLRALGLPAARTSVASFRDDVSEEKALVVERFDRELVPATADAPGWILRLPQEDFCQATGTPASRKYESDGGPGIREALSVIGAGQRPNEDALVFAMTQLAFWLLAAPDGHAKNFSIFLRRHGHIMTPLYDVLSAWPIVGGGPNQWAQQKVTLAMGLRGKRVHRKLNGLAVPYWQTLALQTGLRDAFTPMVAMVEDAERALAKVESSLSAAFPEEVWSTISTGVRRQRQRFLATAKG
jgi:serine/threonine-protein kinase HipA